ncbi:MAG: hypothetical protein FWD58_05705 [Firmicutes bacterium]|nr:hypothetical protein [Bacillota bacterium]
MLKKILCFGVLLSMVFSFAACVKSCNGDDEKPTEPAQNGAYVWDDGSYWCTVVVYDNLISVSGSGGGSRSARVFRFHHAGDFYTGVDLYGSVSFKFVGNNLTFQNAFGLKKMKCVRAPSIGISEEEPLKLPTPALTDIDFWKKSFELKYSNDFGPWDYSLPRSALMGVLVEVKRVDDQDFVPAVMKTNSVHEHSQNFEHVFFDRLNLTQGINVLRLTFLGGPFVWENAIRLSSDSEPLYFNLVLDADGNVAEQEVQE